MESTNIEINYSNGIEKNIVIEMCTDAEGQDFLIIHYSDYSGSYKPAYAISENYEETDFAFKISENMEKNLVTKNMLFKNAITGIVLNEPIYPSIYLGTKPAGKEEFKLSFANTISLIERLGFPYFLAKEGQISSKRNERVEDYIKEADEIYFGQERLNKNQ